MTKVVKFGGSLIGDANDFQAVAKVVEKVNPDLIVISATRGTTNLLEKLALSAHQGNQDERDQLINEFQARHLEIIKQLGLLETISSQFFDLINLLKQSTLLNGDHLHTSWFDCILSIGERTSSLILSHLLRGYKLIFAPDYIKTDDHVGAANVDMQASVKAMEPLANVLKAGEKVITQGFIGANEKSEIRTLGREGSDYSATLFAGLLGAESVTIYTDVAGIFEADPKKWPFVRVIPQMSYQQAEEMALKGAKVLFPKTLEPLKSREIPLKVTSLDGVSETHISGTHDFVPAFIFENNQIWLCSQREIDETTIQKILKNSFDKLTVNNHPWYQVSVKECLTVEMMQELFQSLC